MMRSWENREDTVVVDEPFYAAYLLRTGIDHPGRETVIASQPTDPAEVVAALHAPLPDGVTRALREADGAPPRRGHGPGLDPGLPQRAADPRPGRGGRVLRALPGVLRARGHRPAPAGPAPRRAASGDDAPGDRRRRLPARPGGGTCAGCATGSGSRSLPGCWPGRRVRAAATGCGRRTGTTRCGARPGSSRGARARCRWAGTTRDVAEACRPAYDRLAALRLRL